MAAAAMSSSTAQARRTAHDGTTALKRDAAAGLVEGDPIEEEAAGVPRGSSAFLGELHAVVGGHPVDQQRFVAQDEFLFEQRFLSPALLQAMLAEAKVAKPLLNRNYVPFQKKGASVCYGDLEVHAPNIVSLYKDAHFIDWLSRLSGKRLLPCPVDDQHSCALYYYTEPGDFIGWHYDTSFYKGDRYTVLIGLVDKGPAEVGNRSSCRLTCQLFTRTPGNHEIVDLAVATDPGCLVVFNGNNLRHKVTPLGANEERVLLSLEYVTTQEMNPVMWAISTVKDSVAYFGPRGLWNSLARKGVLGRVAVAITLFLLIFIATLLRLTTTYLG